jgi:hypothetical protein
MANDSESIALGYRSAPDAAVDRRVATITRALKWVGWAFLVISFLMVVLAFTPVASVSEQTVVICVSSPLGIGALYLVRAARVQHRTAIVMGGVGFVLLALILAALLIYGLTDLLRERPPAVAEATFAIAACSAIFLPIGLGLLALGWGLLRLAAAIPKS